jgi:predicted phosphoribosyltransferase
MFRNREDAAEQLALQIKGRAFRQALVLAIPRGGIVLGAVLARSLDAELDVTLSRKLRSPDEPELTVGAISENGEVYLIPNADPLWEQSEVYDEYLEQERRRQLAEIARQRQLFRSIRPQASVANRSVILTDDGIASGSTMIAALKTVRAHHPFELIVAVPVASAARLAVVRKLCDEVVCLERPKFVGTIGDFYEDFSPVKDENVAGLLREFVPATYAAMASAHGAASCDDDGKNATAR